MNAPLSSGMMQSSEIDTVMGINEDVHAINSSIQNGFLDPRVLHQDDDMEPDSTDLPSQDDSDASSARQKTTEPRRSYLPTGCCYDDRMKLHANADFSASPHHPEDPRRIQAIFNEFKAAGLIYTGSEPELRQILKSSPSKFMYRIGARHASEAEICLMHHPSHYEWVMSLNRMSSSQLRDLTSTFDEGRKSLYVGNLTAVAALVSAGAAIETCKSVVLGKVKNAIAVIRPPGHHAESTESLGFCIFNNVPIAAAVCMRDYPERCRKVLILDWDVHHGNGIQNMFYADPNVLYISLHVYQNGLFYPGQADNPEIPDGGLDKCGIGKGLGTNVNIGWADQGVGDGEYMAAFQRIVMPIAQEFDPDLVIISAGFDAAAGDELGGCFVTPACYSHMTHMLMSLADGKVAVCLEGGYNLGAISRSALAVAKTLMGEPPERMTIPPLNRDAAYTLDNVKRIQSAYWDCMRPGVVPVPEFEFEDLDVRPLADVVRSDEKSVLAEKFDMVSLYIHRTGLNRIYKDQVLCTPEIYKAKKILLIIHDPPEVLAQPDPFTNLVSTHNTFITSSLLPYIAHAHASSYGIITLSMPRHLLPTTHLDSSPPRVNSVLLAAESKELLCYIWDNYLELNPTAPIILMGVGDSYLGIKELLISRENSRQRVAGVISFVSGSLKAVKSEVDPGLSAWYKANSRIYVSPEHACWSDEESARKVKKQRFGAVIKADLSKPGFSAASGSELKGGTETDAETATAARREMRRGYARRGAEGMGDEGMLWRMLKRYEGESAEWMENKLEEWWAAFRGGDETEEEDEDADADGDVEMGRGESARMPAGVAAVPTGAGVGAGARGSAGSSGLSGFYS